MNVKEPWRRLRGFALFEVVIALAILALSLAVLLQIQGVSFSNAARSRDLTIMTLLARSKMIDIEKKLFKEGFSLNNEDDSGDFSEEDHPEITWHYKINLVDLDLSALSRFCGNSSSSSSSDAVSEAQQSCQAMFAAIDKGMSGFIEEIGRSLRSVELEIKFPAGKYQQQITLNTLVIPDDFNTMQQGDQQRLQDSTALPGIGNSLNNVSGVGH